MNRLDWYSGCPRRALGLALALAVAAQLPGTASAGAIFPNSPLLTLDLTWTSSLMPVPGPTADAPEPPPLLRFGDAPNQLFSMAAPSPGLQFSLNPDNEEVFLGWQFEF